jgi:Helix-turn-helix domain
MAKQGSWNSLRFKWKSHLLKTRSMSRGAKQLGVVLCDTYVDKDTGKCWPGNEELSRCLGASVRSVQRHVNELIEAGWIQKVRIPRRRRGLQLEFPSALGHYKHDKTVVNKMPKVSPQHDKTGAPYIKKEPSKNQRRDRHSEKSWQVVPIKMNETSCLSAWRCWCDQHLDHCFDSLLKLLRNRDIYKFPSRFPRETAEMENEYKRFFGMVVQAKGTFL